MHNRHRHLATHAVCGRTCHIHESRATGTNKNVEECTNLGPQIRGFITDASLS